MLVKDLINRLQKVDGDMEVLIDDGEDFFYLNVDDVYVPSWDLNFENNSSGCVIVASKEP